MIRTNQQKLLNISLFENYQEVMISSCNTKIVLSLYETNNKNKPCIIFVPGTMTHPLFYDEYLSELASNGYNVVGIHLISHGKSPRKVKKYTFNDMVQNIKDTISYCMTQYNEDIILMGSSQGGILSLYVASIDSRIKAVFPHNILLPSLRDSISVTSFPKVFKLFYRTIVLSMRLFGKVFPTMQIPITFYLKLNRIFTNEETKNQFLYDPIGLTKYPLIFLSSLFSFNTKTITNQKIQCPVVVIASKKDTLFPYDYCLNVYEKINADRKDMVVFDLPHHLILNETVHEVIDDIVYKLKEYACEGENEYGKV